KARMPGRDWHPGLSYRQAGRRAPEGGAVASAASGARQILPMLRNATGSIPRVSRCLALGARPASTAADTAAALPNTVAKVSRVAKNLFLRRELMVQSFLGDPDHPGRFHAP